MQLRQVNKITSEWSKKKKDSDTNLKISQQYTTTIIKPNRAIDLIRRVFANGPGHRSSILGRVIPKTLKMVLDTALLNTQHYKVWIKVKWSDSGKGVAPPLHLHIVAIEKGAFESPSTKVANFTYFTSYTSYKRHSPVDSYTVLTNQQKLTSISCVRTLDAIYGP